MSTKRLRVLFNPVEYRPVAKIVTGFLRFDPLVAINLLDLKSDELMQRHGVLSRLIADRAR
jgi:hypothetical protein